MDVYIGTFLNKTNPTLTCCSIPLPIESCKSYLSTCKLGQWQHSLQGVKGTEAADGCSKKHGQFHRFLDWWRRQQFVQGPLSRNNARSGAQGDLPAGRLALTWWASISQREDAEVALWFALFRLQMSCHVSALDSPEDIATSAGRLHSTAPKCLHLFLSSWFCAPGRLPKARVSSKMRRSSQGHQQSCPS